MSDVGATWKVSGSPSREFFQLLAKPISRNHELRLPQSKYELPGQVNPVWRQFARSSGKPRRSGVPAVQKTRPAETAQLNTRGVFIPYEFSLCAMTG